MGKSYFIIILSLFCLLLSNTLKARPLTSPATVSIAPHKEPEEEKVNLEYEEPQPPGGSLFSLLLRSFLSLGVIIILIYFTIYGLRFFLRTTTFSHKVSSAITLLDTFPLSSQKILYLFSCGEKVYLVAFSEKNITKIDEWPLATFKEITGQDKLFSEKLKSFREKIESGTSPSRIEQIEARLKNLWKKRS